MRKLRRVVGIETVVQGQVVANDNGLATVLVNGTTLKGLGTDVSSSAVYSAFARKMFARAGRSGVISARNHLSGCVTVTVTQHALRQHIGHTAGQVIAPR